MDTDMVDGPAPEMIEAQRQHQMAVAQYTDMSQPNPTYATLYSAAMLQDEMVMIAYGHQVHPSVRPRFSGSIVTPLEAVKGLHKMLGSLVDNYEAHKLAEEQAQKDQILNAIEEGAGKIN